MSDEIISISLKGIAPARDALRAFLTDETLWALSPAAAVEDAVVTVVSAYLRAVREDDSVRPALPTDGDSHE